MRSSTEVSEAAEITVEFQELGFELINESAKTWRRFKDSGHGAARKLRYAAKIHAMIINAMQMNPDIQRLKDLTEQFEELRKLKLEAERKKDFTQPPAQFEALMKIVDSQLDSYNRIQMVNHLEPDSKCNGKGEQRVGRQP